MTTPDPTRSKAIEVMARAMGAPVEGPEGEKWGEYPPFKRFAELALTAYESHLQAEGMAVVLVESADKIAALMDHEFHAGTRAGWDAAHADNPIEAFAALDKTQKERLSLLAASPYGKASMQEASAEAQSAVANTPSMKAGKEESK